MRPWYAPALWDAVAAMELMPRTGGVPVRTGAIERADEIYCILKRLAHDATRRMRLSRSTHIRLMD